VGVVIKIWKYEYVANGNKVFIGENVKILMKFDPFECRRMATPCHTQLQKMFVSRVTLQQKLYHKMKVV